MVQADKCNFI